MNLSVAERVQAVEAYLGHSFSDRSLAIQAITHPSSVEHAPLSSYQRLEFLGDAVLGMCVADYAYRNFPSVDEGVLTKMRVAVVQASFLAQKQRDAGFADLIIFGASEQSKSARGMTRALEDSFESLVGALYLDGGFNKAYEFVIKQLGDHISPDYTIRTANPKSELQELVQKEHGVVEYRIISELGPAHAPKFVAQVLIDGVAYASAEGESKKQAEAAAAAFTLEDLHEARFAQAMEDKSS